MAITEYHRYGWAKEVELTPRITDIFGEAPSKKVYRWSETDFETSDYHVELKSRQYPSTAFATWYVPCCKFKRRDKETVILNHWSDDRLFYHVWIPGQEQSWHVTYNAYGQATFEVPRELWTEV
jgi:hypothetical protein